MKRLKRFFTTIALIGFLGCLSLSGDIAGVSFAQTLKWLVLPVSMLAVGNMGIYLIERSVKDGEDIQE